MSHDYYQFRPLEALDVARIHGTNALRALSIAHQRYKNWQHLDAPAKNQSWEEVYQDGGAQFSRSRTAAEDMRSHLFASVILFQAAMEAMLTSLGELDDVVSEGASKSKFHKKYEEVLKKLELSLTEFNNYNDNFYKKIRIPLTHLDNRRVNDEDKLDLVNSIKFEDVYTGIRNGWWTQSIIIQKVQGGPEPKVSWGIICGDVNLDPNLYPNEHPD